MVVDYISLSTGNTLDFNNTIIALQHTYQNDVLFIKAPILVCGWFIYIVFQLSLPGFIALHERIKTLWFLEY